jgi:hypothetical protein
LDFFLVPNQSRGKTHVVLQPQIDAESGIPERQIIKSHSANSQWSQTTQNQIADSLQIAS